MESHILNIADKRRIKPKATRFLIYMTRERRMKEENNRERSVARSLFIYANRIFKAMMIDYSRTRPDK